MGPVKSSFLAVMRRWVGWGVRACTAILSAGVLASCGLAERTLVLTQASGNEVELTALDLNPSGDAGDVTTFEAPITKEGQPYGSLMGTMTKVGSIGAGLNKKREERLLTAVFDLPQGQISVLGVSYYREGAVLLPAGEPVARAIVGGTGAYVGVDGEVTTVRNQDGSYTHTLRLR